MIILSKLNAKFTFKKKFKTTQNTIAVTKKIKTANEIDDKSIDLN